MGRIFKIGLALGSFIACFFVFTNDTSALGSTFPAPSNNPDGKLYTAMVSDSGPGVTLNAKVAQFRIAIPENRTGSIQVRVINACAWDNPPFSSGPYNDVGPNLDIRISIAGMSKDITSPNDSQCNGDDVVFNVPNSEFRTGGDGPNAGIKVFEGFRTDILVVRKINGTGIKSFKVQSEPGTYVSFKEDLPLPYAGSADDAFSVWNASKSDPINEEASFQFKFKVTPCNYDGENVWVNWQDADYGESNETGNNIRWRLIRDKNNSVVESVSGSSIGGNNDFKHKNVGKLRMNETYTWRWDNVDKINGIQIFMPFSEISLLAGPCVNEPPPDTSGVCEFIRVSGAPGRYYKVYVNDYGSPGTVSGTPDYQGNLPSGPVGAGGNVTIIKNLVADNKAVTGTLQFTVIVYNGNNDGTGRALDETTTINNCFRATCQIDIIENVPGAPAGSNDVIGGQRFGVNVRLRNTGSNNLTFAMGWNPLASTMHINGIWGPEPNGVRGSSPYDNLAPAFIYPGWAGDTQISPGGFRDRYFELNAPDDINVHNLSMHPDYWGRFAIGPVCSANVDTHKRYDFAASASSSLNDNENPTSITFNTGISQQGVAVDGTTTRSFFQLRNGGRSPLSGYNGTQGPNPHSGSFGNASYTDNYGIASGSFVTGDRWCVEIVLDRGHGWRGPGNNYYNESPASANNCDPAAGPLPTPVTSNPYIRAYSSDIAAGGGFGTSCGRNTPASGILAYIRPVAEHVPYDPGNPVRTNKSGSGGQLAALALGQIKGFTSASIRNGEPNGPKGLTFGHDSSAPNGSNEPFLGGNMSGDGWCLPDFYNETQFTDDSGKIQEKDSGPTSPGPMNLMTRTNGQQTIKRLSPGAKLRILGSNNYDRKHTVFVDGDVYIDGNIMYRTDYSGGSASIPSFTLVVRGDIFIDHGVSQIDGLYIAQPHDANNDGDYNDSGDRKGRIFTCSRSNTAVAAGADMYNYCGAAQTEPNCSATGAPARQLTVNGSFVAQRVILNRTSHSLRCSQYLEQAGATRAAEVFNFSQEVYLSPPIFRPTGTSTSGDYDYISILAPIL